MRRLIRKRSSKSGLPPGTLVHIGETAEGDARVSAMEYDADAFVEMEDVGAEQLAALRGSNRVSWINVDGVHRIDVIEKVGSAFHLHPLVLEDIANTEQRPKVEDYGDYMFIVLKMLDTHPETRQVRWEQVSIVLGPRFVISFQEPDGDVFNPLRERIRGGKGRLRQLGADYLVYSLMDLIVDRYFIILENLGEAIEYTEEALIDKPDPETMQTIHQLKTELIFLRKCVWPLREVLGRLERGDNPLVEKGTSIFFRDVYDHTVQVMDTVETYRDMVSGMLDIYLSSISNRMNAVMRVLTVIATIFMPLTFLAGIYGMNFKYMPELDMPWAYPTLWGVILLVGASMLTYFRKRGWI